MNLRLHAVADWRLADRGHDADWLRDALKDKGTKPCISGRKTRKKAVKCDKRRNRIGIMFGRLNDWRRVATRYDRCPEKLGSAIMLVAIVLLWLRNSMGPEPERLRDPCPRRVAP